MSFFSVNDISRDWKGVGSKGAAQPLHAGHYLFIPFLRTKSLKGSDEKIGKAENCIKKDHRTNIITV